MLDGTSRSAALRRPQGGTPPTPLSENAPADELVGDQALVWLGLQSATHAALCGTLLRAQIRTYKRTRHIISFQDEYSMRRIRNAARTGRLPAIYCRCMRCGCIALLIDWCAAADLADDPTMPTRRWPDGKRQPVSDAFFRPCTGSELMQEELFWTD